MRAFGGFDRPCLVVAQVPRYMVATPHHPPLCPPGSTQRDPRNPLASFAYFRHGRWLRRSLPLPYTGSRGRWSRFSTGQGNGLVLARESGSRLSLRRATAAGSESEFTGNAHCVCVYYCSTYYKAVRVGRDANSFIKGTTVINTHSFCSSAWWSDYFHTPRLVVSRIFEKYATTLNKHRNLGCRGQSRNATTAP